jgi:hypothetical protein
MQRPRRLWDTHYCKSVHGRGFKEPRTPGRTKLDNDYEHCADAEEQAKAMYRNFTAPNGVTNQIRNYNGNNYAQAVIQVYVEDTANKNMKKPMTQIIGDMTQEIINQGPRNVSNHCATIEEWNMLNVVDIDSSAGSLFLRLARAEPRIRGVRGPSNGDPAYHLPIPQEA